MAISFDEAALSWAKQLMRAEQAEAKVKELEEKLKSLSDNRTQKGENHG